VVISLDSSARGELERFRKPVSIRRMMLTGWPHGLLSHRAPNLGGHADSKLAWAS
jgi:hypothetical protein